MAMRAANLETTGGDHATVQRNLNAHGAQKFEHYAQEAIIGYFRETAYLWEYKVVTMYGNSKMLTDILNDLAANEWCHYLTVGSRGYFKRAVGAVVVAAVTPEPESKPASAVLPAAVVVPVPDAKVDRTGIPQMIARNGGHSSNGRGARRR